MQRLMFLPLTAALLVLSFMGCEPRSSDRGTSESKAGVSNSELEKSIKVVLDRDDHLRNANLSVTVDSSKNEATLKGTVESEAQHAKAIEIARSVQPGLTVNDKVDVKPREIARKDFTEDLANQEWEKAKRAGEKVGRTIEDAWLHGMILAKLVADPKTQARNINVDVVKGMVTLRGKVADAAAKSEAERVAMDTEGVKSVENRLEISSS